jgi:hypothetical protein
MTEKVKHKENNKASFGQSTAVEPVFLPHTREKHKHNENKRNADKM